MTPFHVRWSGIYIYIYIHDTYVHKLIHCLSWNIQHLWHKERCTTNCTVILGEVYCCLQLTVYCMQHGPSDPARRRFGRLYFCPAHLGSGTNRADRKIKIPYGRYGPGPVRPHSCSTSTRAFVHTIHITYAGTQNRPLSERENCVIDNNCRIIVRRGVHLPAPWTWEIKDIKEINKCLRQHHRKIRRQRTLIHSSFIILIHQQNWFLNKWK